MAYEPIKTEELKKLVMMGKKRPMNMAYNPGPKEADLLIIDRIKAPDVIARVAKKEGEGTKVAFGTFEVDARKFNFTVSQMVPGLSKKLRRYLKSLDMSFTVEIFDLDGTSIEADSDEDETNDAGDAAVPAGPNRKDLTERLRALQKPIAAFGAAGEPLKKAVARVVAEITGGDLVAADGILTQIETAVARAKDRKPKPAGQDAKVLMARAASLKGVLGSLPEQAAGAVRNALVQALSLLQARDLPAADAKLTAAEKVVNALSQRKPKPPANEAAADAAEHADDDRKGAEDAPAYVDTAAETRVREAQSALAPAVEAALEAGKGDTDAIRRAFDYAGKQAAAGRHDLALKALAATEDLIDQARKTPDLAENPQEVEAPELSPEAAEAFDTSRLEWSRTRSGLQAELVKLKMAIDARTSGIDGLEDVSSNTEDLLDYIEELDTSLQDTLDVLAGTQDGVQRRKLMDEARRIMGDYRAILDTDFFKAVDGNGFVSTAIRDTALTALGDVENALTA